MPIRYGKIQRVPNPPKRQSRSANAASSKTRRAAAGQVRREKYMQKGSPSGAACNRKTRTA